MSEINKEILEDDEAYLIVPEEHVKKVAMPETVWAKIGDDGKLEVLRWDIISLVEHMLREVDARGSIAEIRYYPQMLVLKKR